MIVEVLQNGNIVVSKDLGEGSYKIGRAPECEIQLKSPGVSKNHALLVIKGNRAAIVDTGSANGIFVNGILVRKQRIEPEDEVRIVDFYISVANEAKFRPPPKSARPQSDGPMGEFDGNLAVNLEPRPEMGRPMVSAVADLPPAAPQEKLLQLMDQKILLPFYHVMKMFDWRGVLSVILLCALLLSVLSSVWPIVRWGRQITTKESLQRAHSILRQCVRENHRVLTKTNDNTRLTVEVAEAEKGMLSAYIIDPTSNSVLAPAKHYGKTINDVYSLIAIKKIVEGKEEEVSQEREDDQYVVAQPIMVYAPETNENHLSAIVIGTFQVTTEISSTFNPLVEASLFAILCSLLAFFFIYKMVTFPITSIQEQLDAALKGEDVQITCDTQFAELQALATQINFAVSRAKQAGGGGAISADDPEAEDAHYIASVEAFDEAITDGILLLDTDKKVRFVGHVIEELVNMKNQYSRGKNISDACQDPGYAGTAIDLSERVFNTLGQSQTATLDINGQNRTMVAVGHKNQAGQMRFSLVVVKMNNG